MLIFWTSKNQSQNQKRNKLNKINAQTGKDLSRSADFIERIFCLSKGSIKIWWGWLTICVGGYWSFNLFWFFLHKIWEPMIFANFYCLIALSKTPFCPHAIFFLFWVEGEIRFWIDFLGCSFFGQNCWIIKL